MTLLLNYRPVLRQPTGIGVYANAVLPALQQLPHVLIPGGEEGTAVQRLKRLAWTQLQLPRLARRRQVSLIFTPAPEGYLGPQAVPQVVMVHDLRPISHPDRSCQSIYFRSWVPPLLRACRHVLTNSKFTALEIQRCTGLSDSHISVIPLGYDADVFSPAPVSLATQGDPYLLHVGQAYPHKNLRRLIQVFAVLAPRYPGLKLVLAGKPHPQETPVLKSLVAQLGLQMRVQFRSYVPYSELPGLYRGALALVYPSLWEGFGLPVLEAMACGTPVITSVGSGTQEVAGDAALLIKPSDSQSMWEGLNTVLASRDLRERLSRLGLQRAAEYNWSFVAAKTVGAVRNLLDSL